MVKLGEPLVDSLVGVSVGAWHEVTLSQGFVSGFIWSPELKAKLVVLPYQLLNDLARDAQAGELRLFELLGYRREGGGVTGSLLGRQVAGISRTMVPNAVEFSHAIILNRVVR